MGLFDRLFGKIEEPKIEDVVKEALENIDLSDDSQQTETLESENIEVKEQDGTVVAEENDENLSEADVDEETIVESVDEVKVSQKELNQVQEADSPQEESTHVEEIPSNDSDEEEIVQPQSDEAETEFEEEANQAIEETRQVQETVQEKYDRSLKKTRTGFGARLNAFFANFRSVDEDFFEELEELLIMSDVGVQVASNLTEELRYEAKLENAKKPEALRRVIIRKIGGVV